MAGDTGLADIVRFTIKKNSKTGNTDLLFLDDNKRTGEFLAARTLREKFSELNIIKSVLSLHETPSALEKPFKAATKLRCELPTDIEMESVPLMELSSLVEDIYDIRHEKHRKIMTLTCENFYESRRPYKAYRVNF